LYLTSNVKLSRMFGSALGSSMSKRRGRNVNARLIRIFGSARVKSVDKCGRIASHLLYSSRLGN
ncbi:hypothetical protein PMAYCL1PPCAC_08395, partial [Pristionchus mayeri]